MEYCFLQDIFCSRWSFYLAVCSALLFPRLHAVSPDHSDGAERPDHSSVWLFPAFICYGISAALLFRRNVQESQKEGTDFYYGSRSFSERFSVQLEIIPGHNRMHSGKLCKSCSHGRGAEIIRLNSICHTVKKSGRFVPAKAWISNGLSINTIADGLISVFNITFDHDSFYQRFDFGRKLLLCRTSWTIRGC